MPRCTTLRTAYLRSLIQQNVRSSLHSCIKPQVKLKLVPLIHSLYGKASESVARTPEMARGIRYSPHPSPFFEFFCPTSVSVL